MLTTKRVTEMMTGSLRSPEHLCERLGLQPNEPQIALMRHFQKGETPIDVIDSLEDFMFRGVAIAALWRLLLLPGSKVLVVASMRSRKREFMRFLGHVTSSIDPALSSISKWTNANTMLMGNDPDYWLRAVSNNPGCVMGLGEGPKTIVILGAAASDLAFVDTLKALEPYFRDEQAQIVRIW